MKIASGNVSMASTHVYESHIATDKTSLLTVNDRGAKEAFTPLRARMDGYEESTVIRESEVRTGGGVRITNSVKQTPQAKQSNHMEEAPQALNAGPQATSALAFDGETLENMKASILRKMLELLNGVKNKEPLTFGELTKGRVLDLRSASYQAMDVRAQLFGVGAEGLPQAGTTSGGTIWRKVTETNVTQSEREATTFQTQGFAVTEDGRALSFDVSFAMSREFTSNYNSIRSEDVMMTDPLIINLDGGAASLSGSKFEFDLDADGQTENISFAGAGSGFLALDANGNGVIDDGSELFGAKSGDGFADLAAYDDDGNGWIDENDAVYDRLRVWTSDRLMNLKEANVGAIYLDSVRTEHSLNDAATNETNGILRRTGMYLKETGEAGTISHVDLRS